MAALIGVDLDRYGDAVQRAERLAAAHLLVGFAGSSERLVSECLDDGVDARVDGGETIERRRDGLPRRDRAGADRLRQIGGVPLPELSLHRIPLSAP